MPSGPMQLWLIPILPLAAFLINGLFGRRFSKGVVNAIAIGSVALSFAWVLKTLLGLDLSHPYSERYFTWIQSGAFRVDCEFTVDKLTAVMLLVVTGVGSLIHVYSVGYMAHEGGYYRFFAYLNLFMFFMLTLVLAANYLVLFVGWEGVGLCSYLLIGFYFDKKIATDAGNKAFIVNRIGDFGFSLAVFYIVKNFGSLDFKTVFEQAAGKPEGMLTLIGLLLMVGACGKSAQLPLYVWLPDAMAGPTPVSALIHAATMVTAGVYLVARCNVLFRISHEWAVKTLGENASFLSMLTHDASLVVAVVGGTTAVFAASMGFAQTDIKKVLAFSAGMFHVFTHAWFKACLFLGSGSVIHAMSGEQEMDKMGGLKGLIPQTYRTMFIATLAIAGVPFLSGFFSKDSILGETFVSGHPLLWLVPVITAGMTAFYMFRLVNMTFYGDFHGTDDVKHHVHESPATMTVPLWILAIGAIVVGYWGVPKFLWPHVNKFDDFLEPIFLKLPPD